MPIIVDRDKCTGCETCVNVCPFDAIKIKDDGKAFINEYCQMCMACLSACPEGAIIEIKEEGAPVSYQPSDYKGVWVFAEQREGSIAAVSLELLGAGRKLADELKTELSAVLFGASEKDANELIKWGADKVYHSGNPIFEKFNDEPYSRLLVNLIKEHKPAIVLAGATPIGRSFIPRVAASLRTGLTADCTSLGIDKDTGNLLQIRPAFGGNIMATILCPNHRPQIATVRPRVMKKGEYNPEKRGEIVSVDAENLTSRTKVIETIKETLGCEVNLQEADIIIAGGRGLGDAKGFNLLFELAEILGGTVGASRAAVDEGWIQYRHQVGQTGKTVCPKIYIACGISGAVQHLVGMQSSDIIIAINKNPEAPIFNVATYGIVGDIYEVLPLLIKKLKEIKS
ncbi:MAG: electron transfer flavoprotein subunit alpha [Thermodesulfovibrionales bacterium]|nr:electron transfer flavoprotein subunit alpha [Thermodesulfovibrionales bacterium]